MTDLSHSRLLEVLEYDKANGGFSWKRQPSFSVPVGSRAGTRAGINYCQIKIDGRVYSTHRLVWFYHHGRWPAQQLDHVNFDRDDNRIENLREATPAQNSQHRRVRKDNKSGTPGVVWHKASNKWSASIQANGVDKHLGVFETKAEASEAYASARKRLFPHTPYVPTSAAVAE